jgi:phenylpropionate dioxygenase-like ring-hydroxylating dioxygenase large terminal subunit
MFLDTMRKYWMPMAFGSAVESKTKKFQLLGEALVAYRDESGPVILKDRCVHRGAALSNGWLTNGNLTCPYHGWQYNRSGACVAIPSMLPGGKIPASARVPGYQVKEAFGLVWVFMSAQPASLPEWPDDAWNRPDFKVFCTGQYVWEANAVRVVENALDVSHFNFAHRGFTELADGPVIKPHTVETQDGRLMVTYEDGHVSREFTLTFPFILHNRKRVVRVEGGATWSSNANSKVGDITTISFVASPISETQTLFFGFISRNHSLDVSNTEYGNGLDIVLEQDRAIVESQTPKMVSANIGDELHVQYADIASIAYRKMFKAAQATVTA